MYCVVLCCQTTNNDKKSLTTNPFRDNQTERERNRQTLTTKDENTNRTEREKRTDKKQREK